MSLPLSPDICVVVITPYSELTLNTTSYDLRVAESFRNVPWEFLVMFKITSKGDPPERYFDPPIDALIHLRTLIAIDCKAPVGRSFSVSPLRLACIGEFSITNGLIGFSPHVRCNLVTFCDRTTRCDPVAYCDLMAPSDLATRCDLAPPSDLASPCDLAAHCDILRPSGTLLPSGIL